MVLHCNCRDSRLRQLIIDLAPPTFAMATSHPLEQQLLGELNASQQEVVATVMRANDYALILGMPGTGDDIVMLMT